MNAWDEIRARVAREHEQHAALVAERDGLFVRVQVLEPPLEAGALCPACGHASEKHWAGTSDASQVGCMAGKETEVGPHYCGCPRRYATPPTAKPETKVTRKARTPDTGSEEK